jgi:ADP-ribose pyrophosphatase YjhB (NUDIX family)
MMTLMEPSWLRWARELQAIGQIGDTYSGENHYDRDRYARVRQIAAEMVAAGARLDTSVVVRFFDAERGYATPKVDVRGVVFREGRLLMVREASDGLWTLPGGWADVNESAGESVVREVQEESGFATRAIKLLAVLDRSRHGHEPAFPFHVYKMFVRCEILGGAPAPSSETTDVGFFDEHHLPPLSVSRVTSGQLRRVFEHLRHPEWPTDFD